MSVILASLYGEHYTSDVWRQMSLFMCTNANVTYSSLLSFAHFFTRGSWIMIRIQVEEFNSEEKKRVAKT